MPMWYFITQNACDTAFSTLFRTEKRPKIAFFYISLTINTIQTYDNFHSIKPIVSHRESYHFTPWKLSNDDVKAITLQCKGYHFIAQTDSKTNHFPFSCYPILHIYSSIYRQTFTSAILFQHAAQHAPKKQIVTKKLFLVTICFFKLPQLPWQTNFSFTPSKTHTKKRNA